VIIPFLKQFVRLVERVIPSETGKQTTLLSLGLMDTKATTQGMLLEAVDADMTMYRGQVMEFVSSLVYAKFGDMEAMQQRYSYLKNMGENILSALHHGNVVVTSPEIVLMGRSCSKISGMISSVCLRTKSNLSFPTGTISKRILKLFKNPELSSKRIL
jgi:hypothetical protein